MEGMYSRVAVPVDPRRILRRFTVQVRPEYL